MRWIPLMEYAMLNGVSLSTLRRHIKANKLEYKVVAGRYLLADSGAESDKVADHGGGASAAGAPTAGRAGLSAWLAEFDRDPVSAESRIRELERSLSQAREEIAELKTLVAFYEERR